MDDNTLSGAKAQAPRTVALLGMPLVIPSLLLLLGLAGALAGALLLVGMMGGPASVSGFVFGCGLMWLTMTGLDLKRPKAWIVLLGWVLLVFGTVMAIRLLGA